MFAGALPRPCKCVLALTVASLACHRALCAKTFEFHYGLGRHRGLPAGLHPRPCSLFSCEHFGASSSDARVVCGVRCREGPALGGAGSHDFIIHALHTTYRAPKGLQRPLSSVLGPGGPTSKRRAAGSPTDRRPDLEQGPSHADAPYRVWKSWGDI